MGNLSGQRAEIEPPACPANQGLGHPPVEHVAGSGVLPLGRHQELLQGADGGAGGQGDRLDRLAGQVGQQPP